MPGRDAEAFVALNVFFDVDHTLVHVDQHSNVLRPGASEAIQRLKAAGHHIYVWSAGGQEYVERQMSVHGLIEWLDGCFDKDPRVRPYPDLVIDDDSYLVAKYGGYCVSQYKALNHADRELLDAVEALLRRD